LRDAKNAHIPCRISCDFFGWQRVEPITATVPPQTQATQPNKSAAEDERSTENAPFIVTIPPPTQAAQESATDTKSEQKESTSDEKVADLPKDFTGPPLLSP
jgi:hypothetical protein